MAGRALFKNHITIKPVASQATKVSYSGNTMQQKDELGIVTFFFFLMTLVLESEDSILRVSH